MLRACSFLFPSLGSSSSTSAASATPSTGNVCTIVNGEDQNPDERQDKNSFTSLSEAGGTGAVPGVTTKPPKGRPTSSLIIHSTAATACAASFVWNIHAVFLQKEYVLLAAHYGITSAALLSTLLAVLGGNALVQLLREQQNSNSALLGAATAISVAGLDASRKKVKLFNEEERFRQILRERFTDGEYSVLMYMLLSSLPASLNALAFSTSSTLLPVGANLILPFQLFLPGLLGSAALFEKWHREILFSAFGEVEGEDGSDASSNSKRNGDSHSSGVADMASRFGFHLEKSSARRTSKSSSSTSEDHKEILDHQQPRTDSSNSSSPDLKFKNLVDADHGDSTSKTPLHDVSTTSTLTGGEGGFSSSSSKNTSDFGEDHTNHDMLDISEDGALVAGGARGALQSAAASKLLVSAAGSGTKEASSSRATTASTTPVSNDSSTHQPWTWVTTIQEATKHISDYLQKQAGAKEFATLQVCGMAFDLCVDYVMTQWRGAFFDTFQTKNVLKFQELLKSFGVIAISNMVASSYSDYMTGLWDLHARAYFVDRFATRFWLKDAAFYKMALVGGGYGSLYGEELENKAGKRRPSQNGDLEDGEVEENLVVLEGGVTVESDRETGTTAIAARTRMNTTRTNRDSLLASTQTRNFFSQPDELRNCDQRLHEDVQAFVGGSRRLTFGFADAVLRLAFFFPQLVYHSPPGLWELCLLMSVGIELFIIIFFCRLHLDLQ